MTLKLRPHQTELVELIKESMRKGNKRILAVASCGYGKSKIIEYIGRGAVAKGKKIWIVAHRHRLLMQLSECFSGINYGFVHPDYIFNASADIQICSIQTLARRMERMSPPDLLLLDESHRSLSGQYRELIKRYYHTPLIGFTATPERSDGQGLGEVYKDMIIGSQPAWLIDNGYLAEYKYYTPISSINMEGVARSGDGYEKGETLKRIKESNITGNAVDHYRQYAHNEPSMAFCSSIEHADITAEAFNNAGYIAVSISGKSSKDEQKRAVEGLENGTIHVVCSCELFGEGVDIPILSVCILLRHTNSTIVFIQQSMRCMRTHPLKKFGKIFDHVGNSKKHGYPCTEREWSLEGNKKTKKVDEDEIDQQQCKKCFAIVRGSKCKQCGKEKQVKPRELPEEVEGVLVEVDVAAERAKARRLAGWEEAQCQTIEDWLMLAQRRGYSPSWAHLRFKLRKRK